MTRNIYKLGPRSTTKYNKDVVAVTTTKSLLNRSNTLKENCEKRIILSGEGYTMSATMY